MKEITIGGVKYLVPEEAAAAIEASNAAVTGEFTKIRGELDSLKARPAATAPAPAPQTDPDDLETQIFLDPKKALSKFKDEVKAEMRQEYTVEQGRRQWWDEFYKDHKHLKSASTLVEAVMGKHFNELRALPVAQQAKALADKVDAELAAIIKDRPAPDSAPTSSARPVEPGGLNRTTQFAQPNKDDLPSDRVVSIGELQRKQRERRMQARAGRVSA